MTNILKSLKFIHVPLNLIVPAALVEVRARRGRFPGGVSVASEPKISDSVYKSGKESIVMAYVFRVSKIFRSFYSSDSFSSFSS